MRKAYYFVFGYFVLLVISYSNHFDNPFFFDDHHTIVQNTYVHSIKNLPLFFYDTKTASTRPDLQGYRPIVQVLNAVDYSLGSGSTKAFHIHIFTHFLILLYLVFYMIKRIFERSSNLKRKTAIYLSLFITGFFGIHASHTETINYIISRSDLFSTLCMLLAFLLYDREKTRRRLLFLIPLIIGYFTKQVVASFAIIIWIYDILFIQTDHSTLKQKVLKGSKYGIITLVVLVSTFIVSEAVFSDIGNVVGPKKHGRLGYLQTQIFIVMHYIGNFFVPIDLSADPDFTIIGKFWDKRIIYSLLGHIFILIVALTCLKRRIYYPIAFGILWFYIALAPTSTLVPLGQISNDHRTMFPFIGLCLSAGYGVFLLYSSLKLKVYKQIVLTCVLTIFLAHGYGIKERNEVWGSEESLWLDASIKSPKNSRALMNYGLTQMEKGKYDIAKEYFYDALELDPYYSTLHINIGIIQNRLGNIELAEEHFKKAIRYLSNYPSAYRYYARFLKENDRIQEAYDQMKKAYDLSPSHIGYKEELDNLAKILEDPKALNQANSDNHFNRGKNLYDQGKYSNAIKEFKLCVGLDSTNAMAYNNICASFCHLKEWEMAIEYCKKAIEVQPELQIAKNNLGWAIQENGTTSNE